MKEKKIIIFIINIFAFVLSIIWIINSHGLESIITALILFTSLVSQVCIKKKGTLQIVARHNKGGKNLSEKMEEVFGNVKVLAKKRGYRVYLSQVL